MVQVPVVRSTWALGVMLVVLTPRTSCRGVVMFGLFLSCE